MIDQTGQRANETGWTKEAVRAAKKARAKAESRAMWAKIGSGVSVGWDFFLRNLLLWLSVAGLIAVSSWEWWNTSRGWNNLYPGLPTLVPFIGAFGAIVLYFFGFRQWREHARAADAAYRKDEAVHRARMKDARIWLSVTLAAYLVCVAGVFIATATAAEKAKKAASDSRVELQHLKIQREDLAAKVELNDPEMFQIALDADRRKLKALVDTAIGTYGLPDLDVRHANEGPSEHGCPAPPKKFTIERLCAQANGGIDPFNGDVLEGLRTELKRGEKRLADAQADAAALDALDKQIREYPVIQGDETADALGAMFAADGGTALGWLLLALSSLFLYGGGWLGDWVFERLELMRAKSKAAKGA